MSTARELLDAAEAKDGYRAAIAASELNAIARRGQRYEPFFVDKDTAAYIQQVTATTPLLTSAQVIIMHPTADNGYPHTRPGDIICMPTPACNQTPECERTLLHEAIHLHQRAHPGRWNDYCLREGWWPQPLEQIPLRFRERTRINPDTMAIPFWSWQTHYIPLPLFTRDDAPRLSDVQIKWLDTRNGVLYSDPPSSFIARYGRDPPQPEHPFELLAVECSNDGLRTAEHVEMRMKG